MLTFYEADLRNRFDLALAEPIYGRDCREAMEVPTLLADICSQKKSQIARKTTDFLVPSAIFNSSVPQSYGRTIIENFD